MSYLPIFITALMILTLGVVLVGVVKLATNKKAIDSKKTNNLMILRVALQAMIIVILFLAYFFKYK